MLLTCLGVLAYGLGRERPHLVLIVVDSLRADARSDSIGAARTPNLDSLAREGLVFHEAFAHSPSSLPAMVSLLSGRHPHESRVTAQGQAVPQDVTLLAEHLGRRGYQTRASIARAALRPPAPGSGIDRGFARFDPGARDVEPAEEAARRAIAALDALDPQRPFFLLAHIADPHGPFETPQAGGEDPDTFMAVREQYKRAVEAADRAVGAILYELHRRGLFERSLVVVTSNHGLALGEHGRIGSGATLYDEALRVPLIVRLPRGEGCEELARLRHRMVRQADLAPTLLELLGLPALPGATGSSLFEPTEDPLLAQAHPPDAPGALLALRDPHYKLVLDVGRDETALFRLASDPLELDDVSSHQGHLRSEWREELSRLAGRRAR